MPRRLSQYSKDKLYAKKDKRSFLPDLKEWVQACELYCYDKQIYKHFCISHETFYAFLDSQRLQAESGKSSAYIEALKNGRNKSRQEALLNLKNLAKSGDAAGVIFTAKTFGGLVETKEHKLIEIRKYEVSIKTQQFLTQLAEKFNLNKQELTEFATTHFKDSKLELI